LITVTEEAKRYVHTISSDARLSEGLVFRLDRMKTGRCSEPSLAVIVDEPREGDQPVEHEGDDLLHISGAVSTVYDGSVLDLEETPRGTVFILVDPPGAGSDVRDQAPRTPWSPE
jgi:Fe-S cluster assembly iron-binding protein IscA